MAAALPALDERDRTALALVALAGAARPAVALRLGIDEEAVGESLARGRKELRRTLAALPGSGWCERSERLISDRIDGPLAERDAARLDVHLRNCPRCVEHERRLVQATDALVSALGGAPRTPVPTPPVEAVPEAAPAPVPIPAPVPTAPAPATPPSDEVVAAAAEVLVAARTRRQIAAAVVWNSMIAIAIVLMLATIALTIAGILGAHL